MVEKQQPFGLEGEVTRQNNTIVAKNAIACYICVISKDCNHVLGSNKKLCPYNLDKANGVMDIIKNICHIKL